MGRNLAWTCRSYSLRAARRPRASAPVGWDEIEAVPMTGDDTALRIPPEEALRRLDDLGDPWEAIRPQELPEP